MLLLLHADVAFLFSEHNGLFTAQLIFLKCILMGSDINVLESTRLHRTVSKATPPPGWFACSPIDLCKHLFRC